MSLDYSVHEFSFDAGETVQFLVDDEVVASATTFYEAPEDNTCSRIQIANAFMRIVGEINVKRPSHVVHEYGEIPWGHELGDN